MLTECPPCNGTFQAVILVRVHVAELGQLVQHLLALDRRQCLLRLESRAVDPFRLLRYVSS